MREKELRLALVCYGGVSLAVYMHGVTKEVWKLLRASSAVHAPDPHAAIARLSDSERVYADLLVAIQPHVHLRVLVDIVAGASAGGINGVFLAHAIAGGYDMEVLRDLWLRQADVEELLAPEAQPLSRWSKIYAAPLAWYAERRRSDSIDRAIDPAARTEVRQKLSRFVRARWFEPPFSGPIFTTMLLDALAAMQAKPVSPPLIPTAQPLDLFVTVTDYNGFPERLRLHSPAEITETEHRKVISFRARNGNGHGRDRDARMLADLPSLTFAARATASFPGAFPPFQVGELDAVLAARNMDWPDRADFLAHTFPRYVTAGLDPAQAVLIDGSVLNNAPFAPAIEALRNRPAHREVDRRFVYIDPKSGQRGLSVGKGSPGQPGFFTTILRSLADIPREQPIRDDLEAIEGLSRRVRRLRHVVSGMRPDVDAAIESAIGRAIFWRRPTPRRFVLWRRRLNETAAQKAGFAYAGYAHLKLSHVVEAAAELLAFGHAPGDRGYHERARTALWRWIRAEGIDNICLTTSNAEQRARYIDFMRQFDLGYRIRRLRFLIRRLTELQNPADMAARDQCDQIRTVLYELLAPFLDRRDTAFFRSARTEDSPPPDRDIAAALAALSDRLALRALDAATDQRLMALLMERLPDALREGMMRAYLGFPFFDMATLPLLQGEGLDEFDEIKVDRLSPDDATAIREGGVMATLKGVSFNSFGGFFSRAYRENDYLWGRLHGADRLIDIVLSAMPKDRALPAGKAHQIKTAAFHAIIDAERDHLRAIPGLFEELAREIH